MMPSEGLERRIRMELCDMHIFMRILRIDLELMIVDGLNMACYIANRK